MKVNLWGTRGSQATPGPEAIRYGGNTSCVEVRNRQGDVVVLDAGTGIRRLGDKLIDSVERVDVLLTHLHPDHIQGLGFFACIFRPDVEVHLWGPAWAGSSLSSRLSRYLSPPLFPVFLRELPRVTFHDVTRDRLEVPGFEIHADLVCHPGPTLGYRLEADDAVVAYMPDHEPALVARSAHHQDWRSGHGIAHRADLLIHDAQYTAGEYPERIGWGHSTMHQALGFAIDARCLMPFHHDPAHDDAFLDLMLAACSPTPMAVARSSRREKARPSTCHSQLETGVSNSLGRPARAGHRNGQPRGEGPRRRRGVRVARVAPLQGRAP